MLVSLTSPVQSGCHRTIAVNTDNRITDAIVRIYCNHHHVKHVQHLQQVVPLHDDQTVYRALSVCLLTPSWLQGTLAISYVRILQEYLQSSLTWWLIDASNMSRWWPSCQTSWHLSLSKWYGCHLTFFIMKNSWATIRLTIALASHDDG